MKKWLLLLGFALNFGGACYGMDPNSYTGRWFKKDLQDKKWDHVIQEIRKAEPVLREELEKLLLAQNVDNLNMIVSGDGGLFESLLSEYYLGRGADENQKNYWKALLKKSIIMGLDFKVQDHDGHYLYKYHKGIGDFEPQAAAFWLIFDELMDDLKDNPDKKSQLCSGFETEIAARQAQQQAAQIQQNAILDQQQPTHNNAPVQKAKTVFNKKLATTGLYVVIGCAVLAIGYQVYKRYTQDKSDDEEQEANDPEATIAKDTV